MDEQPTRIVASVEQIPATTHDGAGVFLIHQRLPPEVWRKLKQEGAWYIDADQLEDMRDVFAQPGWRYALTALESLIQQGYQLSFPDWLTEAQQVTTVDQLRTLFTPEAQANYRAQTQAEQEAREQSAQERAVQQAHERETKEHIYRQWQETHLAGLVATTAPPSPAVDWAHAAFFDKATPGAWYTTGDEWFTAVVDGHAIYKNHYGSAVRYYAPQNLVDAWCIADYARACSAEGWSRGDPLMVARWVVEHHDQGNYGHDVPKRLVELHGLEYYLQIARSTVWLIALETTNDRDHITTAQRYTIPYLVGTLIDVSYDTQKTLTEHLFPGNRYPFYFYRTEDGQLLARQNSHRTTYLLDADQTAWANDVLTGAGT